MAERHIEACTGRGDLHVRRDHGLAAIDCDAGDIPSIDGKDVPRGYLSSQMSSMRQLLMMLLTIIVQPFTGGCQQYAKRL